ncbi:MAG: hypothetical protein MRZ90_03520 [Candidatus Gastranaerophilales bacterium]|nr:hypothetical protein [Candidatus Gastranaerophilales bacterium]
MSVSNVNSIYGAQMGSNAGYDTPAIKIEEKESNIGAWLCGGLALVATLGVGIAAHKSGKAIASNDDNMFQTIWKGVKSWVGKNGDDVAKNIDDIPAECKTSLKTLFSEGKDATLTATQKQDIIDNADEISQIFSSKARKNATKATRLAEIAKTEKNDDKLKALAEFFGVEKKLKITDEGKLDITDLSLDDQARITRKLGDINFTTIKVDGEGGILDNLSKRYTNKQKAYNTARNTMKHLTLSRLDNTSKKIDATGLIAKRFNRASAAQRLAESCEDTSSYINTQASLTKWLKAGDLTQDEYDNLRAYAEQKFMNAKDDGYLNYLKQTLKKADGSEINFNSLDEASITLLNNKFKGFKLTENTKLNINDLLNWKKENTKSISEYLGLNGCSLSASDASGFKLVDGKLVWEASAEGGTAPEKIFDKPIGSNCKRTTEGKTATRMTLTLDNIKKIFESVTV